MLKAMIEKLVQKQDLSYEQARALFLEMLHCKNTSQIAAILVLFRAKTETIDELHGFVDAMKSMMHSVSIPYPVLDIVGTGGDGAHTLNISTASAILAASMGVKIAKHGNRSVSSRSGSADVLEALNISITNTPEAIVKSIDQIGIGFLFAPEFHPALKTFKTIRSELNIRTFFNLLGPLLNPASPEHLMLGVSHLHLLEPMAELLRQLGTTRSFVFHGCGLDEISSIGPTDVIEVTKEGKNRFVLNPSTFGLSTCSLEDLKGKDASYNAEELLKTLEGKPGAFADTIALNAAIAAYLYGKVNTIEEGLTLAQEHLKQKKGLEVLTQWTAI